MCTNFVENIIKKEKETSKHAICNILKKSITTISSPKPE